MSDVYRDLALRGGMPDTGFARHLRDHSFWGLGQKEDIVAEADRHPLMNGLWEDKVPLFEQITVPAYVVASYSNTLHTAGTFRAWRRMASPQKWLRIHNGQEWPDYYDEGNVEDLRRFFDHCLKGVDNGWEQTPRVRYSVLDLEGGDRVAVAADEFPPLDVTPTKFYLDGRSRALVTAAPEDRAAAVYGIGANPDVVSFITRFEQETVLVGCPKAHLWVEGAMVHDLTERGATILRYKGSDGRLRVSLRHLDDLLPIGLSFHAGEQLRLVVSGRHLLGPMMPGLVEFSPANSGQHVIHTGGDHASYLQLPVQAR